VRCTCLALLARRRGVGDKVITVCFRFVASVAAITYTGARPVFVDIDGASFTIATDQIRGCDHATDEGDPSRPSLRAAGGRMDPI